MADFTHPPVIDGRATQSSRLLPAADKSIWLKTVYICFIYSRM